MGPGLFSFQDCGVLFLTLFFLLVAHGKFGFFSFRPLLPGPEFSVTLVLAWKGVQGCLPTACPWPVSPCLRLTSCNPGLLSKGLGSSPPTQS